MGTSAFDASGAPGMVAIPSGRPSADCREYVRDANTGCEQSSRAYPVAIPPWPRVATVSHDAGCTTTLALLVRRSGPIPKSEMLHVAGKPPMLAISKRDVNTDPSPDTPSTICGKTCVALAFCA